MDNTMIFIILIGVIFIGLLIWGISLSLKEVSKEWDYLEELKKRTNTVETKDDIHLLHQDMLTFANKTRNEFIHQELVKIDSFLRGLYKNAK